MHSDAHTIDTLTEIITDLVGRALDNGTMTEADAERVYREAHAAVAGDPALLGPGGDVIHEAEQAVRASLRPGAAQ